MAICTRRALLEASAFAAAGVATDAVRPDMNAENARESSGARVTMFLCGDVMLGRGIDQILPHPGDPQLFEPAATSAATYVEIAERANGPIPRPVDFAYVWGDALEALRRIRPDAKIINLETSITTSDDPFPKGINYRMHPANVGALTVAGIDCCVLANNHVMDWGRGGLLETLATLERTGIASAGAGRDAAQATAPAVLDVDGKARVLVLAFGSTTSGIPGGWAAGPDRPGVNLLDDLSESTLAAIANQTRAVKRPGDVLIASIHWGGNWGYDITRQQRAFARGLIDRAGVDVVHGHSSHHVKGIEVYKDRPILYGCGDFLTDYEGISGYEAFRDDLAVMYLPTVSTASGWLVAFRMIPFQIRKFRLNHASPRDAAWLRDVLNRESARFGVGVTSGADGTMALSW